MSQHDNATAWEVEAARRREVIAAEVRGARMDGGHDAIGTMDRPGRLTRLIARFDRSDPGRHAAGRATLDRRYEVRSGG